MRSIVGVGLVAAVAVVAATTFGGAFGPAESQPAGITMVRPPIEFPAVGNIEAVRKWRLARIESLERRAGSEDVLLRLRTADQQIHEVLAPREPMGFLARQCGWVSSPTQTFASRSDYAERLIAFDVDDEGRIIACMSLEPFARSASRMRRAFCNR